MIQLLMSGTSETPPFDVIIIGGSYSGLSAALALGRARRNVLVIDASDPCNARVPHSHNLLTHDGVPPRVLRSMARADVAKYPTVQFYDGRAEELGGTNGSFAVRTAEGLTHRGRKLLLALGVRDELPPIKGLAECWGISAAACPFCHGYEVRDQRLVVIGNTPETIHYAKLIHNWSDRLAVCTNGPSEQNVEHLSALQQEGITVVETPISEVLHDQGQVKALVFADGSRYDADALFLRSTTTIAEAFTAILGLERTVLGLLKVDHMQQTNVAGVFASGDCTTPMRSLTTAMATGTMAGASITHALMNT
ncbi:MAG: NAD(P)/FAD-dependent oxidoreductase [Flavobacteriales bacterium]|nr:NAD(P)/FAD-dependent oxidoreductase [Flavobacteriales bacterium]